MNIVVNSANIATKEANDAVVKNILATSVEYALAANNKTTGTLLGGNVTCALFVFDKIFVVDDGDDIRVNGNEIRINSSIASSSRRDLRSKLDEKIISFVKENNVSLPVSNNGEAVCFDPPNETMVAKIQAVVNSVYMENNADLPEGLSPTEHLMLAGAVVNKLSEMIDKKEYSDELATRCAKFLSNFSLGTQLLLIRNFIGLQKVTIAGCVDNKSFNEIITQASDVLNQ